MPTNAKDPGPKTTIWRKVAGGSKLVETIPGLPFGTPIMRQVIQTPKHGNAECTGVTRSGSGQHESVIEIQLTVR